MKLYLLSLIVISLSCFAKSVFICPLTTKAILINIKNNMGGNNWIVGRGWGSNTDYCLWQGIVCDQLGDVISLDLRGVGVEGPISQYIACLQKLQGLYLSDNYINSPFSSNICKLKHLKYLHIEGSGLTGTIPKCLCNLKKLVHINLGKNNISGEIPQCFSGLSQLKELDLDCNQLQGNIPQELTESSSLEELHLNCNPKLKYPSATRLPVFQCSGERCSECPAQELGCPLLHKRPGCGTFRRLSNA